MKKVLVYLPLDPEKAKINNLPVKLPVILEDLKDAENSKKINLDIILRGLEAQFNEDPIDEYYLSYYLYYLFEKTKTFINENKFNKAIKILEKTKRIKEDYRYFFYYGLIKNKEEDYESAEILFKKTISINNSFFPAIYEMGRIHKLKKEYDDAIDFFTQAIEASNKNFLLPLIDIIDCYLETMEYDNALYIIEKTDDNFPFKEELLLRKGIIYNEKQKFSVAEKTFSEALKLSNDWKLYYNRSFSLLRLGMFYKSFLDLKSAYKINESPFIEYELGLIQKKMGFFEDALKSLENYYEESKDEKALFSIVKLLIILGRFKESEEFVNKNKLSSFSNSLEKYNDYLFINPYKSFTDEDRIKALFDSYGSNIFEKINYEKMIQKLNEEFKNERIKLMKDGIIGETTNYDFKSTIIYLKELINLFPNFNEMELFSYRYPFIVSGKGDYSALCRTLFLIIQRIAFTNNFEFNLFVDEIIEDIKDLSFFIALRVSRLISQRLMDLDSALELIPSNSFEFLNKTFSILENDGYNESIEKNDALSFFFEFLKKIKDVIE